MPIMQFDAYVHVSPESNIVVGNSSWAPNIYLKGSFYPGRITSCPKLLYPGDDGNLTIGIIYDEDQLLLEEGEKFELRDGPSIKIADGVVI